MTAINPDSWAEMSATVNRIKRPITFLRELLFPGEGNTYATEQIEWGVLRGERVAAPFGRRDGQAQLVKGLGEDFETMKFPNIRLKMEFTAPQLMNTRAVGSDIFVSGGGAVASAADQIIGRDLAYLRDHFANIEEWMAAQSLLGSITYTPPTDEFDSWEVDYGKTQASVTAAATWATASNDIGVDFDTAKTTMWDLIGEQPDICLLDAEAAANFRKNTAIRGKLDYRNVDAGNITLRTRYEATGARYLGELEGIEVWEYRNAVTPYGGSKTALLGAGHAHFISRSALSQNEMAYGPIQDMEALEGRTFVNRFFSKSWITPDPAQRQFLVHSRPVPLVKMPDGVHTVDTTP